jgi:TonB-linked SusC/RagA family outer membrane protein
MKKHFLNSIFFLLLVFAGNYAYSQSRIVTGTVTAKEDGLPMPGVTVRLKGTNTGTQTNTQGKYSLTVPAEATLVFSFITYESQQVVVTGPVINVVLTQSSTQLNEIVVTGVGVATSKRNLGISVESVSSADLPQTPSASVDEALIGKIPGAEISSIDGTPGAHTNILLRGINTLQGGTLPLIMVDGVEMGATDISTIDLSNVDRIEVVQGAAAATIYGAQGANGVIQIFTKKGKPGKPKVSFSTSAASGSYINSGDVHQATLQGFYTNSSGQIANAATGDPISVNPDGTVSGISWEYPAGTFPSAMANPMNETNKPYGTDPNYLTYHDHLAEVFKSANTLNNSLSISGGTDKSDYNIALSDNNQQSNIRNNGYVDRTNLSVNVGTELFKGFTIRSTTQLAYTYSNLNPAFQSGGNALFGALNTSPFIDFDHKLADGTYPLYLSAGTVSVNSENPNYLFEYSSGQIKTIDIVQSFDADYKINHFLELDGKYGLNYQTSDNYQIYQNQSANLNSELEDDWIGPNNGSDNTGEIDNYTHKTTFENLLASLYFRTNFQKDFHLNVPVTTSTQVAYDYRKNTYSEFDTYGYSLPTYAIYNMNQTASQQVLLDEIVPFITFGYLVNQRFDIGDYGGVSGGFRSDYSSAFGAGSKPFTFPRADGYIRPSSFSFWKDGGLAKVIPEFKLRAAFGEAGIQPQPFDRYVTLNTGNLGNQLDFSLPNALKNPNLQVELSKEFEAGTDFTIKGTDGPWFSEYDVSATYWTRKGSNIIYSVSVAPSSGGSTIKNNAIGLASDGLQASFNVNAYRSKDFTWNFTWNISHQTSTITSINGPPIILSSSAGETALVLQAGSKIGQIYGYKALTSLNETNQQGVPYISPADYSQYQMVDGRVVNIATKGIQFTNQAYSFGDPNPKFNTSLINSFSYKNFITLGFQFDWVYGQHTYDQIREWMYRDGISSDYQQPVTIGGQTGAWTAYYRSAYADVFGAQNGGRDGTKDYFYEGSSFLRLRNLSLGFDLNKFIHKKVFNRLQVVLSGRNLLTVTKYKGLDPEAISTTPNSAFDRGVDNASTPNSKVYQLGLNLTF